LFCNNLIQIQGGDFIPLNVKSTLLKPTWRAKEYIGNHLLKWIEAHCCFRCRGVEAYLQRGHQRRPPGTRPPRHRCCRTAQGCEDRLGGREHQENLRREGFAGAYPIRPLLLLDSNRLRNGHANLLSLAAHGNVQRAVNPMLVFERSVDTLVEPSNLRRKFHKFIIVTMILTDRNDSDIR